jgi:hypothetical protein
MTQGRFDIIFDRLNASVVLTETMTATIHVERRGENELDELRRLATEFAQAEPQTCTTA